MSTGVTRLIEDVTPVTPAERRAAAAVAEYEVESLKEGREVYVKRGQLFFRSSHSAALKYLDDVKRGAVAGAANASTKPVAAAKPAAVVKPAVDRGAVTGPVVSSLDSLE